MLCNVGHTGYFYFGLTALRPYAYAYRLHAQHVDNRTNRPSRSMHTTEPTDTSKSTYTFAAAVRDKIFAAAVHILFNPLALLPILSRTSSTFSIFCFPSHQQPTFRCTRLQGMKLGSICSLKAFPNSQAKIWPKEISYVFSAATADHRLSMPQCLDITPRNLLTPLPYSPS